MEQIQIIFKRYLSETLAIDPHIKIWKEADKLPFFLKNLYVFFEVSIMGEPCLAMVADDITAQTPAIIKKHVLQVKKKWNNEVIYIQQRVTAYNRKRLIEQKIPFVIPGNQMYLPFLGIDLREHFRKIQNSDSQLSPSSQVVILYAFFHKKESCFTPKGLANQLGYSAMTMTRVLDELQSNGLGRIAMEGRERVLRFDENKKILWENVSQRLRNPVKKHVWIKQIKNNQFVIKSGLSALAYYSTLAEPLNAVFAIDGKKWKGIKTDKNLEIIEIAEPEAFGLEIWIYPPELFAKNGVVDQFSLYLCMQRTDDERVKGAINEMMEGIEW